MDEGRPWPFRAKVAYVLFDAALAFGCPNYFEYKLTRHEVRFADNIPTYEAMRHELFDHGIRWPMEVITTPGRNLAYDAIRREDPFHSIQ